jgi:adenine-specific DNA-methyltransferase
MSFTLKTGRGTSVKGQEDRKLMDKISTETPDIERENAERLAEMFPSVVTEVAGADGTVQAAIDVDALRDLVGEVAEGARERYQFTWPGKRKAKAEAYTSIDKTMRPEPGKSLDWDGTQNLYIEGDNLEVLKLLRNTYAGKVKLIYIDPPYNTGHDFVYEDDFAKIKRDYDAESGDFDESGGRLVENLTSNGRFHSDWCSMIYPRLLLARDLLRCDGVFAMSIDDNEQPNSRKILDEIFGEQNFEGNIHWRRRHNQPNDPTKMIGLVAEHILVYAKNSNALRTAGSGKVDITGEFSNPDNDPRGEWGSKPWKTGSDQSGSRYVIKSPTGKVFDEERMGEETTFKKLLADGRIYFPKNGEGLPRKKYYRDERANEGQSATNWWSHEQFGHNQGASDELASLFGMKNVFSNPKPISLVRGLIQIANVGNEDIVLDFFAGSSTTAHAVMQLNFEDGLSRRFICVQYPENLDDALRHSSGKRKSQLQTSISFLDSIHANHVITEIGEERIRRAGAKIKTEVEEANRQLKIGAQDWRGT